MISFLRVIKFAFQDIGRNFGLSTMTVFVLVLMLLSVNIFWSVDVVARQAVGLVKNQVNVSVYIVSTATSKEVEEVKSYISSFSEVAEVKVTSKEEVLASFEQRHKMSPEILNALKELGGNPFGPTIMFRTHEPEQSKKILDALNVPEYDHLIESKSFEGHEDAVGRLQNITNRIETIGLGLSLIFAVISFLIIFNTIRVAIYTQRAEISIKRLVGAHNWFIRGPYLVESLVFTLLTIALTGVAIYFAAQWIDPYLSVVFPNGFTLTNYYKSNILYLTLVQTGSVLLLTTISSSLAMRKHLKV
jgi:cell division transport system permease protein